VLARPAAPLRTVWEDGLSDGPTPPRRRFFTGPLDDWPNDDLLFEQGQRDFFYRHHPRAAPIFDWPELRVLFDAHDPPASRFRKRSRRSGVIAVLLGSLSLILTAFVGGGLLHEGGWAQRILGASGAVLALFSFAVAIRGIMRGGLKERWLSHRFWTERMRQLHFQLIINHLPLAARVIEDPAALPEWQALRARTLDEFVHRFMLPTESALDRMRRDVADDQPWLTFAWASWPKVEEKETEALAELFEILKYQRFGIQRRYSELKLKPGFSSPRTRSEMLRRWADNMTGGTLILAAVAGIFFVVAPTSPWLAWIAVGGGLLSALILGLRVLDEGLQLKSETERYVWYLAAVEALERRYDGATVKGRVEILRDMERLSYQELRWFTTSFDEARFVM
jgi:hypothetical protein